VLGLGGVIHLTGQGFMFLAGIDFGTSNSTVASPDGEGGARVLRDADGEDKTPSVVYFGEETIVGVAADDILLDPEVVIRSVKRSLLDPPVIGLPGGRLVTPVEVAGEIVGKLLRDARAGDEGPARAAIARPADFDVAQTTAINEAAELAGFAETQTSGSGV
jgi:molecular chaperone DnaK